MRTIRIHFAQDLVVALQTPLEARNVGTAQTAFAFAMQHKNLLVVAGEVVSEIACAVGAVVVNNKNVHVGRC